MTTNDDRPWLRLYGASDTARRADEAPDALAMFAATLVSRPHATALRYFGQSITFAELDGLSDAFASAILAEGFEAGERVAIYCQNVPQFVIAQLGTWKAGGIAVAVNPMYRRRELVEVLSDSGASVLVCLQSLYRDVGRDALASTRVRIVLTTCELDFGTAHDPRLFATVEALVCEETLDFVTALEQWSDARPRRAMPAPDDIAVLTYTSGTTGPPKGAMTTHANLACAARTYRDWIGLGHRDVVLGVAPLFHVTGLVGHVGVSLLTGAALVLTYRFDPSLLLDTIEEEGATFTVGSITVYTALAHADRATRSKLATLRKVYCGGAPVPPAAAETFYDRFGTRIHNAYGLTETTSFSHAVPFGTQAPVDDHTGALSVGVPVFDTVATVVDENGSPVPTGELGEIVVSGPQVTPGYWGKPDETAQVLGPHGLHTGDVGYMDEQGWFYVVDRLKDQINAGGYKIWPREVEDVLYEHPAVREAAVIGVPDDYRGETVKAYVALRPSATTTPEELTQFARERLAAYKAPRMVEIVDEIPKNAAGKMLRRELRARDTAKGAPTAAPAATRGGSR